MGYNFEAEAHDLVALRKADLSVKDPARKKTTWLPDLQKGQIANRFEMGLL